MRFYKTKATCPDCGLEFEYALSEEDLEDELGEEVFCPRCGEPAIYSPYTPCPEREYYRILQAYDELEQMYEAEEFGEEEWGDEE